MFIDRKSNHPAAIILPQSSCRNHPAAIILPQSSCRNHFAVGTAVAGGPPHRSVLEELPHTA
ncbi:hypothetical protein, partial [Rosistilla oblonga]|uniref:hypothetical protein n=1 Tax=Rosistilla oblonga TaxID=2527990 RepID=UPI003A98592A